MAHRPYEDRHYLMRLTGDGTRPRSIEVYDIRRFSGYERFQATFDAHTVIDDDRLETGNDDVSLEILQALIGGYVEHLEPLYYLPRDMRSPRIDGLSMWCDDEGKLKEGMEVVLPVLSVSDGVCLDYLVGNIAFTVDNPPFCGAMTMGEVNRLIDSLMGWYRYAWPKMASTIKVNRSPTLRWGSLVYPNE